MRNVSKKKIYTFFSIIILTIMFIVMCLYASKQSFWLDELDWTINFLAKDNIGDMINSLLEKGYNLPLYYLIMYPIYKIAPYGELWLLLINIIAVIGGTYIVKKIGEKIGGEDLGFLSLCMTATSYALITNCAFELRPYAFLFLFSALTLYIYICRLENFKNIKNNILYTISIILLAYTHWFGCLMIAFYFIIDIILYIRKKITISFILQYFILGILFLPWLILMFITHTTNLSEYWAVVPSIVSVCKAFAYLLSANIISIMLFAISIFIIAKNIITERKNINRLYKYILGFIFSILWVMGTIFIYGKFINPNGSLWVYRYFFCISPQIFIITALPLLEFLNLKMKVNDRKSKINIKNIFNNNKFEVCIVITIIAIIGFKNYNKVRIDSGSYYEPYREVSDIIFDKKEAYEEKSAVLTNYGKGYLTYYFEKREYELPKNVFTGHNENDIKQVVSEGKKINIVGKTKEDLAAYDILYVFEAHEKFDKELLDFINENYELVENFKELNLFIYKK